VDYAHLQQMGTSFPGWFPTDPKTFMKSVRAKEIFVTFYEDSPNHS
jgi:hypothetical protein